jgi:hypothetical protein
MGHGAWGTGHLTSYFLLPTSYFLSIDLVRLRSPTVAQLIASQFLIPTPYSLLLTPYALAQLTASYILIPGTNSICNLSVKNPLTS